METLFTRDLNFFLRKIKPNFDDRITSYFASTSQVQPWTEDNPDKDNEEATEYQRTLGTILQKNQTISQNKWQKRYQAFIASGAAKWYKGIVKEDVTSQTTNMKKLVTTGAAGVSPAFKHTKAAPGNKGILVLRIDLAKKGNKSLAQHSKSGAISFKAERNS